MPTTETLPPLLTVAQVVDALTLSKLTVMRMIGSGKLPALRMARSLPCKTYRIPRESVLALLVPIEPREVLR